MDDLLENLKEEEKELKKKHLRNFRTLWEIYNQEKRFKKSPYMRLAAGISVLVLIIIISLKIDYLNSLSNITDKLISILPNILGFNLAAYALLITVNSYKIIKDLAEDNGEKYSSFQQISSVFAWSVLVQAITLITVFLVSIFISFHINSRFADVINSIILLTILFLSFYSMFLIVGIVFNVFSFSQILHFLIGADKLEEKVKKAKNSLSDK